jgi:AcrR family transcriptional regulator
MPNNRTRPSLRDRKKVKTRHAIRAAAIDLVGVNGYGKTTIEQIAERAEISPATLFRYFPSKDAVLIASDIPELAIAVLARQPSGISTLEACRQALETTLTSVPAEGWEFEQKRWQLVFSNPELRQLQFAEYRRMAEQAAEVECRRVGRNLNDLEMRIFFGALIGAGITALDAGKDMHGALRWALGFIEAGMVVPQELRPSSAHSYVGNDSSRGPTG